MAHDDAAAQAAATYFDAWLAGDFARLRSVLADDVDFAGPLGQVRGGDDCLRGLQGLARGLVPGLAPGWPRGWPSRCWPGRRSWPWCRASQAQAVTTARSAP